MTQEKHIAHKQICPCPKHVNLRDYTVMDVAGFGTALGRKVNWVKVFFNKNISVIDLSVTQLFKSIWGPDC